MIVLERLADGGYFQNNREVIVNWCWPSVPRFSRFLHPMTKLEKLSLLKWDLTLTEDVPQLFRSCPTLTELHLRLFESQKVEMNEELKNELRSGFQRLQLLELHWFIDSWPLIQEMFT
jgi:hypothetical protein